MKRILSFLLLTVIMTLSLASCGGSGLSEAEMSEIFRSLTEGSYALNEVYYGEGLPYREDEALMKQLPGVSADAKNFRVSYMPVAESAPFTSEAAIREETKKIFSDAMCEYLFALAFGGMTTTESDTEETIAHARYIEKDGVLTVRIDLAEDAIATGRTYDFSAITVIADEPSRIKASFPSFMNGEKSVDVRLTIVKTPDGWRLDSPTY